MARRMRLTSTWTLTSSRVDSFAHLGQHGDDLHQKSLAGFPLAQLLKENRVYDNVHDHVDVHVISLRRLSECFQELRADLPGGEFHGFLLICAHSRRPPRAILRTPRHLKVDRDILRVSAWQSGFWSWPLAL